MGEMRNGLNVEDTLQIKKKAKRKTIKWALVIGFIFDIMITAIVLDDKDRNINITIIAIAIMQVIIILVGFATAYTYYLFLVDKEKGKISAALAEGCLRAETWTEVIPIKADEYKKFILEELPTKAKFFAKLREDSDIIDVSVQFHNEREYLPLEEIDKRYFLGYYSILEESEKEPVEKSND